MVMNHLAAAAFGADLDAPAFQEGAPGLAFRDARAAIATGPDGPHKKL